MNAVLPPVRHPRAARLWLLWFGIATAPAFWFAQLLLGYFLWSYRCYPGDTPIAWPSSSGAFTILVACDVLAIAAAIAGFVVSFRVWRGVRDEKAKETAFAAHIGTARNRFLSGWGMLSSGCFLIAILFETIASVMVPSCG